ncbi:MAG TPA: sugar ABC transporter substrate-binding protein [Chloroflexota bacterium]|nr:sugar ABC transporter substrate-binding protein [Chloroflexota bacterium]
MAAKPAAGQPVRLVYQNWHGNPPYSQFVQGQADRFMQKNPDVKVELLPVPFGDYIQKLLTQLAAGSPPDVFWASLAPGLQVVHKNPELFTDLDPHLKADAKEISLDDFWPTAKQGSYYKGRNWGVCWGTSATTYLFYNKTMLQEAGLTTPDKLFDQGKWTWEALVDAALKLTKRSGGRPQSFGVLNPVVDHYFMNTLVLSHGGKVFSDDVSKVVINESKEALQGIQLGADLYTKHKVSPMATDTDVDWEATGKLGMRFWWDALVGRWRTLTTVFDWDMVPPPAGPTGWAAPATSNLWCVGGKGAKHPDESWNFVKYCLSPAEDLQWAKEWGWVPFRKANLEPWLGGMAQTPPPHNLKYFKLVQDKAAFHPLTPVWNPAAQVWRNEVAEPLSRAAREPQAALDAYAAGVKKLIAELG